MFIYPPLLHYRACAHSWWQKVIDVCIFVFGIVATVYNTMETTRGWLF
jgi:solute carrier family 36 (proton-coupled amino acid transporter)